MYPIFDNLCGKNDLLTIESIDTVLNDVYNIITTIKENGGFDMKKIISLLLILVMMVSLVGCFSDDSDDDFDDKPLRTTANTAKKGITRGEISRQVYTNDCMGLTFTAPKTWVYSTDEEVADLMGFALDVYLTDQKFQAALDSHASIYDMMVVDKVTNSNVMVGYENLRMSMSSNITEEQYIEIMKSQVGSVSGMTMTFSDKIEKVKLGETEFTKVVCKTKSYGVTLTQVFYVHKMDGYMGFVIVSINSGYSISDIEAMFK